MKSLKEALISKDKRKWASVSEYEYLNDTYVFLYIPEDIEDIYIYSVKDPEDEDCAWGYCIFDLKELIELYKRKGVLEDSDYIYAIDKKEYKRIAGEKLRKILNSAGPEDFKNSESFNGWPRIDGASVADLSKKLKNEITEISFNI